MPRLFRLPFVRQNVVSLEDQRVAKAIRNVLVDFDHIEYSCPLRDHVTGRTDDPAFPRENECSFNERMRGCVGCPTVQKWISSHVESNLFLAKNLGEQKYISVAKLYSRLHEVFKRGVKTTDLDI